MKSIEVDDSNADLATRAGWLRTAAGHHTKLSNRLNAARTMKTRASSEAKAEEKLRTNEATLKAYKDLAERGSKQENLSDKQKAIIREGWKRKRERNKTGAAHHPEQKRRKVGKHLQWNSDVWNGDEATPRNDKAV